MIPSNTSGEIIASRPHGRGWLVLLIAVALTAALGRNVASGHDFEEDPIHYDTAPTNNAISRLQARLDEDRANLDRETPLSYLKSLLQELEVPVSSQTLVFSKTSLQRDRISPRTPRALYFNDDVYVGYCHQGELFEVSAVDPQLGTVFYTLSLNPADQPKFVRQNQHCLFCHASPNTHYVPGLFIRSVYVGRSGFPLLSLGTQRIDHTSPLDKRWGGWYVTGTHGNQTHLGNLIVTDDYPREPVDNASGQNITSLEQRFATSNYLSPHSDLVALMVLEHQAEAHNLLTHVNFQTRKALDHEGKLNRELNESANRRWDSTNTRINSACESLVKYMLFCKEASLTAPVKGSTSFATEFSSRGPRDDQGRSLRDFDLERRLFRYPCSFLIYSPSFDGLPREARDIVLRRIWEVLNGKDTTGQFSHLSDADRTAISEILCATKPDLPDYWRAEPTSVPPPPALPE